MRKGKWKKSEIEFAKRGWIAEAKKKTSPILLTLQ